MTPSISGTCPATSVAVAILILAAYSGASPATEARERPLDSLAARLEPTQKVVYKSLGDQSLTLDLFEPSGHQPSDRRAVFLTFHGGGWGGRTPRYFYPFAKHFADLGMVGVSAQYRLYNPKRGMTVAHCVQDARSAVRYLRTHAQVLGVDPKRIVVSGGSAGGHLAAGTALFDGMDQPGEDLSVSCMPDLLILFYPVIDTSIRGYGHEKIGTGWRTLSPVDQVKANLPPTLLLHGTADKVTPYAGAVLFQQRMEQQGNDIELISFPGGEHGYFIFDLELFAQAMNQTEKFIRKHDLLGDRSDAGTTK